MQHVMYNCMYIVVPGDPHPGASGPGGDQGRAGGSTGGYYFFPLMVYVLVVVLAFSYVNIDG
jgi:hypothetical protein